MNQEKYNLNWHSYSDHLREMLHEMMRSNELTDVTLVCDDKKQFKAHKIVLSACSSVFKSIINELPQNSSVIFLRGIQHEEMESILEFMYLGVATFYKERMNEFLNVSKSLEIKDIIKDVEFNAENEPKKEEETGITDIDPLQLHPQASKDGDIFTNSVTHIQTLSDSHLQQNIERKFFCYHCESKFARKDHLKQHIQAKHDDVKYACSQCEYLASRQDHLKSHIKSVHEGVKYACNKCDYQCSHKSSLITHRQAKHEGVNYTCNECDNQFSRNIDLIRHRQAKHEGVKYTCNECGNQFSYNGDLKSHTGKT